MTVHSSKRLGNGDAVGKCRWSVSTIGVRCSQIFEQDVISNVRVILRIEASQQWRVRQIDIVSCVVVNF